MCFQLGNEKLYNQIEKGVKEITQTWINNIQLNTYVFFEGTTKLRIKF